MGDGMASIEPRRSTCAILVALNWLSMYALNWVAVLPTWLAGTSVVGTPCTCSLCAFIVAASWARFSSWMRSAVSGALASRTRASELANEARYSSANERVTRTGMPFMPASATPVSSIVADVSTRSVRRAWSYWTGITVST